MKRTREDLAARIDTTNERLDQTNDRLERLERRQHETEVRVTTELIAVAQTVRDLSKLVAEDRQLRKQVTDHEKRINKLEVRRAG